VETRYPVMFLPGGVLPAEPAYASLLRVLGERVDVSVGEFDMVIGNAEGCMARPLSIRGHPCTRESPVR
jgi:hypothetical protein